MNRDEAERLQQLDSAVWRALRSGVLDAAVRRVRSSLLRDGALRIAWEPLPLSAFDRVPAEVASAWVFVLRGGVVTGAERHPNSIQRVMSYRGSGDLQTWDGAAWRSSQLSSRGDLGERWLTIPRSMWHRPVVQPNADWVVISFHTASDDALIEERPADDERPDEGTPTVDLYKGRNAR